MASQGGPRSLARDSDKCPSKTQTMRPRLTVVHALV
jgi:hypothetical protein